MNILIIAANWYNHGDEAAVRSMIFEIKKLFPDSDIRIHFNQHVANFTDDSIKVLKPFKRLAGRNLVKNLFYQISIRTNGLLPYLDDDAEYYREFIEAVKWADYAIYAPGGPSIGDYYSVRKLLLDMLDIIIRNNVPFSFYAPSMGPFSQDQKRIIKVLNKADVICFREEISKGYFERLGVNHPATVTLDAAFQHRINVEENEALLKKDKDLSEFLNRYQKVVGITVTDLKWHKDYRNTDTAEKITETFRPFVNALSQKGYENCFVVDENYDCFFQQYVISKVYAVVGMRYHSNIFSAKMGTPFVSVAYEQKMSGFMKKAGLTEYCIPIKDLSYQLLDSKFSELENHYDVYKRELQAKTEYFREESYMTTKLIAESIKQK